MQSAKSFPALPVGFLDNLRRFRPIVGILMPSVVHECLLAVLEGTAEAWESGVPMLFLACIEYSSFSF